MALLPSLSVTARGGGSGSSALGPRALGAETRGALTAVAAVAAAPAASGPPVAADAAAGAVPSRRARFPVFLLSISLPLRVFFLVSLGPLIVCIKWGQQAARPLPGGP